MWVDYHERGARRTCLRRGGGFTVHIREDAGDREGRTNGRMGEVEGREKLPCENGLSAGVHWSPCPSAQTERSRPSSIDFEQYTRYFASVRDSHSGDDYVILQMVFRGAVSYCRYVVGARSDEACKPCLVSLHSTPEDVRKELGSECRESHLRVPSRSAPHASYPHRSSSYFLPSHIYPLPPSNALL